MSAAVGVPAAARVAMNSPRRPPPDCPDPWISQLIRPSRVSTPGTKPNEQDLRPMFGGGAANLGQKPTMASEYSSLGHAVGGPRSHLVKRPWLALARRDRDGPRFTHPSRSTRRWAPPGALAVGRRAVPDERLPPRSGVPEPVGRPAGRPRSERRDLVHRLLMPGSLGGWPSKIHRTSIWAHLDPTGRRPSIIPGITLPDDPSQADCRDEHLSTLRLVMACLRPPARGSGGPARTRRW